MRMYTQRVPKPTAVPTSEDLAWAAGFLEREGSFTRYKSKKSFATRVSASQVNREPLEKLQRIFGGTIKPKNQRTIFWKKQNRSLYSSSKWIWRIYGGMSREVTKTLFSLLSKRRQEQARELIDYSYTNPNPPTNGPKRGSRRQL